MDRRLVSRPDPTNPDQVLYRNVPTVRSWVPLTLIVFDFVAFLVSFVVPVVGVVFTPVLLLLIADMLWTAYAIVENTARRKARRAEYVRYTRSIRALEHILKAHGVIWWGDEDEAEAEAEAAPLVLPQSVLIGGHIRVPPGWDFVETALKEVVDAVASDSQKRYDRAHAPLCNTQDGKHEWRLRVYNGKPTRVCGACNRHEPLDGVEAHEAPSKEFWVIDAMKGGNPYPPDPDLMDWIRK